MLYSTVPPMELPPCQEILEDALNSELDQAIQELDKLRQKVADKEAELNLQAGELREARRDAQHNKDRVSVLKDMNRDLRKQSLELEKKLMLANTKEEGQLSKIQDLEEALTSLKNSLKEQEELYKAERASLTDRIQFLRESNKSLQEQMTKAEQRSLELVKKSQDLEAEVNSLRKKKEANEAQIEQLKKLCTEMDSQNSKMENHLQDYYDRNVKLEKDREVLNKELDSMEKEMKHLHECLIKEKKQKKILESAVAESEDERASEVESLQSQLDQYRETKVSLNSQLDEALQNLALAQAECSSLFQELSRAKAEGIALREETSRHITELSNLKASKLELNQTLEEALTNLETSQATCFQLQADLDAVQADYEALQATHKIDTIRFENTSIQKTKLIDFLQAQLEEKKKWRLFGGGGTRKDFDQDSALQKQRAQIRQLKNQLGLARRQEMLELKGSTSSNGGSTERMRHSIPHRFQEQLCMRSCKCGACLDIIHFGRYSTKCREFQGSNLALVCPECGLVCHPKCSSLIANTCGLPPDLINYFKDSMKKPKTQVKTPDSLSLASSSATGQSSEGGPLISGWLKILVTKKGGKKAWEQRFLRVEANATLYISTTEQDGETEKLYLQPVDGQVMVQSAVSPGTSALADTSPQDLPAVFKLEWFALDQPSSIKVLYIMALSLESKSDWVGCLEALTLAPDLEEGIFNSPILTLKDESYLDLSCILSLPGDQLSLVGLRPPPHWPHLPGRSHSHRCLSPPLEQRSLFCQEGSFYLSLCVTMAHYKLTVTVCAEFLDMGDTSLSFLHYGATQHQSFPINIFQVSPTGAPQEFLLCYPGTFSLSLVLYRFSKHRNIGYRHE
ncbi:CIT [Cordylochernes scorpioides]|uniref:CIT n=1 Tax=Cordylochernes scorpioides TaxID=51811 RepID=A0ABY6JXF1_9ARAC|nr:CIT [Cordylochernes scorpioides]